MLRRQPLYRVLQAGAVNDTYYVMGLNPSNNSCLKLHFQFICYTKFPIDHLTNRFSLCTSTVLIAVCSYPNITADAFIQIDYPWLTFVAGKTDQTQFYFSGLLCVEERFGQFLNQIGCNQADLSFLLCCNIPC